MKTIRPKQRLSWNGSIEAQRQADAAYARLKPKKKAKKKKSRGQRRRERKLRAKAEAQKAQQRVRPNYYEYINSAAWIKKRQEALKHYGRKCDICKTTIAPFYVVHHLTYKHLGWEPMEDLQVLCNGCHSNVHEDIGGVDDLTAEYRALHL